MRNTRLPLALLTLMLLALANATVANACLTPTGSIVATVESLGPKAGGLEQLKVHFEDFLLTDLSTTGVGCTIGLSTESQIVGPPLWAIQRRTITTGLTIVDPATGKEHHDFVLNSSVTVDLTGEALGLGYFSWPIPVAFVPSTVTQTAAAAGGIPSGPVELVFDLLVKPSYSIPDVVDDLENFGYLASDFSVTYAGTTYLLWSSFPFLTQIDTVAGP